MKANIKVMQKMVLGLVTTMLEQWSGGNEKNRKLKEPKTVLQGSFEINEAGISRRLCLEWRQSSIFNHLTNRWTQRY